MIGGGDSAMEDAIFVSKFASELTVVNRRDEFRASKIMLERARGAAEHRRSRRRSSPRSSSPATTASSSRCGLRNAETGEVEDFDADGAFVAIGHIPSSEIVDRPGRHRRGRLHRHRGPLDEDQPRRRLRRRRPRRPHLPPGDHRRRLAAACGALDAEWYLRDTPPTDEEIVEKAEEARVG